MLDEKAWLSVAFLIPPKRVLLGQGQDSVQASQVHPHKTVIHVSSFVYSQVGRGSSTNCSHKVWGMELSEALRVPFTGAKGPSTAP